MKLIICEGGDQLGKNTLIDGLLKHFNYDNVLIRHFGKPPKLDEDLDPLNFQITCFEKEGRFLELTKQLENDEFNYYENIVIWNRSHYGEYVYGQMFRNQNPNELINYIQNFDERYLISNEITPYFILLTADPEFFLNKEDGKSLSSNLTTKSEEIKLFDEVFNLSLIDKKIKIKVNEGINYIDKQLILNNIINFLRDE